MMTSTFLTAEWRKLAIANYAADRKWLQALIPAGTELDTWNETCYVSLVGFMFLNTRLMGVRIPFHSNFEEVNLRFYVRYNHMGLWKRGVVFIKEIVPRPALTFVANNVYKENYETMPMAHTWKIKSDSLEVEYRWKKKEWNNLNVSASPLPQMIREGSEEEFITEHYWGYTRVSDLITSEYQVEHPRWTAYAVNQYSIRVDFADVYGKDFGFLGMQEPISVMLAEGSQIEVRRGIIIK
ncbi:MAG: DUF2071 domain-containing protein [Chitinophagaceae bacterium]